VRHRIGFAFLLPLCVDQSASAMTGGRVRIGPAGRRVSAGAGSGRRMFRPSGRASRPTAQLAPPYGLSAGDDDTSRRRCRCDNCALLATTSGRVRIWLAVESAQGPAAAGGCSGQAEEHRDPRPNSHRRTASPREMTIHPAAAAGAATVRSWRRPAVVSGSGWPSSQRRGRQRPADVPAKRKSIETHGPTRATAGPHRGR
jgi:hypothetical protein